MPERRASAGVSQLNADSAFHLHEGSAAANTGVADYFRGKPTSELARNSDLSPKKGRGTDGKGSQTYTGGASYKVRPASGGDAAAKPSRRSSFLEPATLKSGNRQVPGEVLSGAVPFVLQQNDLSAVST